MRPVKKNITYTTLSVAAILFMAVLTGVAVHLAGQLSFDYEFEDFFPKSDPDFAFYDHYRNTFGSDNEYVLITPIREKGIFDREFLEKTDSLAKALSKIGHIEKVISPTRLGYPVITPVGTMAQVKWMHINQPGRYRQDAEKIFRSGELVGSFIAADTQSLTLIAFTDTGLSKAKSDTLARAIRAEIDRQGFDKVNMAGRIFGQLHYINKMRDELLTFSLISLVIVIVFLLFTFRSFRGVWIPILVVVVSILFLLSFMVLTGKSFDLLSSLLPTILFVVGMSDVVHIISKYVDELRTGIPRNRALAMAIKHIGVATLLTSVTTAIGFATLCISPVKPVKDFGLYTAAGVLIAYLVTIVLLPALLFLLPPPRIAKKKQEEIFWQRHLHRLFLFILRNKKSISLAFLALSIISVAGIGKIQVNNYLLEDLGPNDQLRKQFLFYEKHYSGARPFEIAILSDNGENLLTEKAVKQMDRLEQYAGTTYKINSFASIPAVYRNMTRAVNGGKLSEYRLPRSPEEWEKVNKWVGKLHKKGMLRHLITPDGKMARISARVRDYGGRKFKELNTQVHQRFDPEFSAAGMKLKFTGMAHLIDRNNETLATNMMTGLVIALVSVALLMGVLFRSFSMMIVTLIPNIIPLLVIGGVMGFTGIDLKITTSIIFTVAFGIAVDDTIHYISKLKLELVNGRSLPYALKRANISTGKAILITSLILISGFFALIFSDFASTHYIGLLISITLIIAVVADLMLLPLLVLFFLGKKFKKGNIKPSKPGN